GGRTQMARATRSQAGTTTSCTSRQVGYHRMTRSGRSPWVRREIASCRTRSIDIASAIVPASPTILTVLWMFIFRTPLPQVMRPTGCQRRPATSSYGCVSICPVTRFSTASTRYRRLLKRSDTSHVLPRTSADLRSGHGRLMVPLHLLLAAHAAVGVQASDSRSRRRQRPDPDQYAPGRAPSTLCGSASPARLGLEIGDDWRQPRHSLRRRLARSLESIPHLACAGHGRSLLQRAAY